MPDYSAAVIDAADAAHPLRLVVPPARNYLNSSFTETPTSIAKEARPTVKIHPDTAAAQDIADGDLVTLGNRLQGWSASMPRCLGTCNPMSSSSRGFGPMAPFPVAWASMFWSVPIPADRRAAEFPRHRGVVAQGLRPLTPPRPPPLNLPRSCPPTAQSAISSPGAFPGASNGLGPSLRDLPEAR